MNIIQSFGTVLIAGLAVGIVFEQLAIPRVVGFIIIGLLLGYSIAHVFTQDFINNLSPVTPLALALAGFKVLIPPRGVLMFSTSLSELNKIHRPPDKLKKPRFLISNLTVIAKSSS